jgi:hypothetical protein
MFFGQIGQFSHFSEYSIKKIFLVGAGGWANDCHMEIYLLLPVSKKAYVHNIGFLKRVVWDPSILCIGFPLTVTLIPVLSMSWLQFRTSPNTTQNENYSISSLNVIVEVASRKIYAILYEAALNPERLAHSNPKADRGNWCL